MIKQHLAAFIAIAGLCSSSAMAGDDLLDLLQNTNAKSPSATGDVNFAQQKYDFKKIASGQLSSYTAEQNIFVSFFNKGDMAKALFQWPSAFDKSSFQNSPTGKAIYSFLVFQNGLTVQGVESLFAIQNPQQISKAVLNMWREELNESHPVWGVVQASWAPIWTDLFGSAAEVRVLSRQNYAAKDIEVLKELLKKSAPDTTERALLEWQLVLALSLKNESAQAGKVLAHLAKADKNPVGMDLINMTASRLLFQNGYLDAAIQYYQKVDKKSDFWFDAQEEAAWSYIRKGESQNTLAVTKTLVNPLFGPQVGPESVFLQAMAQLKLCDYPAVLVTLKEFSQRYKPRVLALQKTAENPQQTAAVQKFIALAREQKATLKLLGSDLNDLPRFVTRDARLSDLVRLDKQLDMEANVARELYGRSLAEGTAKVGFQAAMEEFKISSEARRQSAQNAVFSRIKNLANDEIKEINQTLQKMQIVEAELLQQVSASKKMVKTDVDKIIEKKGTTGSQSRDTLSFVSEKEVWFDELSNYKVDVKKACQKIQ